MTQAIRVRAVDFLNGATERASLARLGASALRSGVSPEATAALVRLTCQAHGLDGELSRDYTPDHLKELASIKLIYWPGGDTVRLV